VTTDERMERLIQLFDDLDDLFAPAFIVLTQWHWLRGCTVLGLAVCIAQVAGSWSLAVVLALPALPVADLMRARMRRLAAVGLLRPALGLLDSRS